MTTLWTTASAEEATGGSSQGPSWSVSGVSIDTRTLVPGDLFVALSDQRDGHDFVASALEKGAAAALVSHVPDGIHPDAPLLIVPDVLQALEALGAASRARSDARVIAVTGSVGKTSTKDMLRHVLKSQGRTHAAEASYNNHWGVPLTLARMPADTEFAVIEIGMNHPGEIAPLSRIARPHVAIVTTVAAAHLEAFESIEGIAHEKAAIFDGLEAGGVAILNADIGTAAILRDAAAAKAGRSISFGVDAAADVRAKDVALSPSASVVQGVFDDTEFLFKVGAPGHHFAINALAVYAAASVVGADPAISACDIGLWVQPAGRGHREELILDPVEGHAAQLIDDAYNANPTSMGAAFAVLAGIMPDDNRGRVTRGRRIAILGDMLELGPTEYALHAGLADHPAMADIARVHCVGKRMRALYDALPAAQRGRWVETAEELAAAASELIDSGDVVLVKGSKGSRVSLVVDAFRRLAEAADRKTKKGATV